MKTISIEIPEGKRAEWVDGVLTLIDDPKQDERPIMERIKTFEDAMEWCTLNGKNNLVHEYDCIHTDSLIIDEPTADLIAYLKMRIITAALNEGWKPQFTDGEWRYFPWFGIITKEEWDEMDDEDKARCVGRAGSSASANGGLVYAYAYYASSYSHASSGSRLAFKSEELAVYAGKQFIEIYADMILS